MPIGEARKFTIEAGGPPMCPVSVIADWVSAVDAGGVSVDAVYPITRPDTAIVRTSTKTVFRDPAIGTNIQVRVVVPAATTAVPTQLRGQMFGRRRKDDGSVTVWELMRNKLGAIEAEITLNPVTDASDGTSDYSTPDLAQTWDCVGLDEFTFGQTTSLALTGAAASGASIQMRIF